MNRLLKDNVALIAVLEAADGAPGGPEPGRGKQLICVANTHIHANPELSDVKLWQVHTLLKGLEKIANRSGAGAGWVTAGPRKRDDAALLSPLPSCPRAPHQPNPSGLARCLSPPTPNPRPPPPVLTSPCWSRATSTPPPAARRTRCSCAAASSPRSW
jgi:hypothetical protein